MEESVCSNSTSKFRSPNKMRRDRVSILPDPILYHILSFLDMKQVVGTSLVSKRWRYFWTSVPCLNFNHYLWKKITAKKNKNARKDGFINFVDKVLFLRDDSRIIKLNITCDMYCDVDRLHAWMIVAARRRVEEVNLVWDPKEPTELTPLVFTPSSGIFKFMFKPNRCYGPYLQLPNSLCLAPMLKSLHLEYCKLPKGNSKGEVTLQCPILKNLTLIDCDHGDLKLFHIKILGLINLVVKNVQLSSNESCKLKIFTINLESITLSGCMYQDYCLECLVSLVNAKFGLFRGCIQAQSLIQVLESFGHAKSRVIW